MYLIINEYTVFRSLPGPAKRDGRKIGGVDINEEWKKRNNKIVD